MSGLSTDPRAIAADMIKIFTYVIEIQTVNHFLTFIVRKFPILKLLISGAWMYCVAEAVRKTDLARLLKDIRSWLEHSGYNSECLTINKETTDIVLVEINFHDLDLANTFVKDFEGWALFPAMISELV